MIVVIGSGAAAVAATAALLERGVTVTLLDAGVELEADQQTLLREIQTSWDAEKIQALTQSLDAKNPIKKIYNSNFVYDETDQPFKLIMDKEVHCLPSLASGGLTNAWGAVVGKYQENQLTRWPFNRARLEPYYQKVYSLLSPAQAWHPDKTHANCYRPSQQAEAIHAHLQQHQKQHGLYFDYAELAVKFNDCRYCGHCQHGCPLELTYSAKHTLRELIKHPRLIYIKDVIVEHISESADNILLNTTHRLTRQKSILTAEQVFCAAGVVTSTALALKSANRLNQKVTLRDSTHFMLPCLMQTRIKNTTTEQLHTLCQLFLKIHHPDIAQHDIHLQIYTYMDYYTQQLKKLLKSGYRMLKPLTQPYLDRLVVIQGYLDSQESHHFHLSVNGNNAIELTAGINPDVKIIMRKLLMYLKKNADMLGIKPIPFMLKMSKIGKSFHYGSSLPMSETPMEFSTDLLGRLHHSKRLHLVDASIFPTIPAGSITPTIMANAYRIASECTLL